jgi:threonine dehydrogenase-like Zn-dependent dehydrogenase
VPLVAAGLNPAEIVAVGELLDYWECYEDVVPPARYGAPFTVSGGPAPARAYIKELLPDVLDGRIESGRVFDRVVRLDEVPDGYKAMNDRVAIKVMVEV